MPDASAAETPAPASRAERTGAAPRGPAGGDLAGHIGRRLAAHRGRRGMRVAELAREVGVTPGLISQIERGLSRPSVSTLFAIAEALDVPVDAFFREQQKARESTPAAAGRGAAEGGGADAGPHARAPSDGASSASGDGRYVVRRGARAVIDIEGGVRWERLTRSTLDHLDFFELLYQPGAQSHPLPYTHPGTEMVLVTSGRLEITVGFDRYLLDPGDSIDFPSSMPHRYVNPSAVTARAVTAILYDCPADGDRAATRSVSGHESWHAPDR